MLRRQIRSLRNFRRGGHDRGLEGANAHADALAALS
jgi:hypothetical protein